MTVERALEAGELGEGPVERGRRRGGGPRSRGGGRGSRGRASSGPARQPWASCSVWEMPSTRLTNTTGETGRKVPVPRRWIRYGAMTRRDLREVLLDVGQPVVRPTSSGGTSVMWVGIAEPCGSPLATRKSWSRLAPRLGDGDRDTDGGHATSTLRSGRAGGGGEADPLVDVAQGRLGDLGGALRGRARGSRSRWAWSSSSSRVRSRNGVTNSTTSSARSFFRSP